MTVAYHLIVCLLLILVQTTLLAVVGPSQSYDLLAPLVVYLGVYRPPKQALPVLLFGGLAMDGLSGGVFGIHLTSYLWLYMGVRWAIQFLHVDNVVLLPLLVIVGIAFESLVMAFCAVVVSSAPWPVESVFPIVSRQVFWGALTGPILMVGFIRGHEAVLWAANALFSEKDVLRSP
jgi:rod shape-determining protein MreD